MPLSPQGLFYMRLAILQSLQTQLGTITTANGYSTDIGQNVEYWDVYPDDYNGPPAIAFRDTDTEYERKNQNYQQKVNVELSAFSWTTKENKLVDSCNLLEDLYQAVVVEPWDSNVIAVRAMRDSKLIAAKGKQGILVELTVEIEYRQPGR
jgi:hypothetical protein